MTVTWVAGGTLSVVSSGTSISKTTPAGIADDDTLLAAVYGRSALTTPAGWTKLIETTVFTTGATNQRLAVFSKDSVTTADSSTSLTWNQASSGRMGAVYAVMRGAASLAASAATTVDSTDTWEITPSALTATANGEMIVLLASSVVSGGSDAAPFDGTVTPTVPGSSTLFSGTALLQYRLAAAYLSVDAGQSNSGGWHFAPGERTPLTQGISNNGLGAVTLRFAPPPSNGANATLPELVMTGGQFAKGNAAIMLPALTAPGPTPAPSFWTRRERSRELA